MLYPESSWEDLPMRLLDKYYEVLPFVVPAFYNSNEEGLIAMALQKSVFQSKREATDPRRKTLSAR
jgi:hypothetical protein